MFSPSSEVQLYSFPYSQRVCEYLSVFRAMMACFSATFGLLDDFILFEDLSFVEFCDIIISHFLSVFSVLFSTESSPFPSLVSREKSYHILSLSILLCRQTLPKHFVKLLPPEHHLLFSRLGYDPLF